MTSTMCDTVSSALHGAAERGDEQQARELLAAGAQVDERNGGHETALHRACMCGHQAVTSVLLEAGGDAEARDADGMQPLHLAAMGAHDSVVALLLACGANHADQARAGRQPLHWAALYGAAGCCQLLVDVSADVGATDSSGKTAVQLAERKGHQAVLNVLIEFVDSALSANPADAASAPHHQHLHEHGNEHRHQPRTARPVSDAFQTSGEFSGASYTPVHALLQQELKKIQEQLTTLVDVASDRNMELRALAGTRLQLTNDRCSHDHGTVSVEGAVVLAVGAGILGLALGFVCGRTTHH